MTYLPTVEKNLNSAEFILIEWEIFCMFIFNLSDFFFQYKWKFVLACHLASLIVPVTQTSVLYAWGFVFLVSPYTRLIYPFRPPSILWKSPCLLSWWVINLSLAPQVHPHLTASPTSLLLPHSVPAPLPQPASLPSTDAPFKAPPVQHRAQSQPLQGPWPWETTTEAWGLIAQQMVSVEFFGFCFLRVSHLLMSRRKRCPDAKCGREGHWGHT